MFPVSFVHILKTNRFKMANSVISCSNISVSLGGHVLNRLLIDGLD